MKILSYLIVLVFLCQLVGIDVAAQQSRPSKPSAEGRVMTAEERELRAFYDAYGEDLRLARREAIADRYDRRGYFRVGNGQKILVSFVDLRTRYLTAWNPPLSFQWKDLSFEVLSRNAANVVGLFDWQAASGEKTNASYSALLLKVSGKWVIRVEDESVPQVLYTSETISGDRTKPGLYRYRLTAQPTASITAHRHSSEMKIKVISGRKFILMGDLNIARVQIYEAGSTFTIPSNTWHVEWWETETVEDIEIVAPFKTDRASPITPRVN